MSSTSDHVVIGMDPHKRSATIEVMTGEETILGGGSANSNPTTEASRKAFGRPWRDVERACLTQIRQTIRAPPDFRP